MPQTVNLKLEIVLLLKIRNLLNTNNQLNIKL